MVTFPSRSGCGAPNFSVMITPNGSTQFQEYQGPVCVSITRIRHKAFQLLELQDIQDFNDGDCQRGQDFIVVNLVLI
jgi:hypothetical protein